MNLDTDLSSPYDAFFEEAANTYNVPVALLIAMGKVESNFDPNVVSGAGAIGIMQLMPGTAASLGVTDPYDPRQNIMGGAKYVAGSTIGTAIAGPLGTVVGFLVTNKTFQKVVAAIMAAILLFLFIIVNFIGILFSYLGFMDANSFANEAQSKELAAIRSRIEQVLEVEAYQTELLSIISQEHDMKLQEIQADYQANYSCLLYTSPSPRDTR